MANLRIINRTEDLVNLALFCESGHDRREPTIVWRFFTPPPGGEVVIAMSKRFDLLARYATDEAHSERLDAETASVSFDQPSAAFSLVPMTDAEGRACAAKLEPRIDSQVAGELRVFNEYGHGAAIDIAQSGDTMLRTRVVWPGGLVIESTTWSLYLALVQSFARKGDRVLPLNRDSWISVDAGDTVTISGSMWFGYDVNVDHHGADAANEAPSEAST